MRALLDADGGVITRFHYDETEDRAIIERVQDVEPILDDNKREMNSGAHSRTDEWRHVAEIPNVVIEKWLRDYGIWFYDKNHWPAVKRLLNSSEWSYLRTRPGLI